MHVLIAVYIFYVCYVSNGIYYIKCMALYVFILYGMYCMHGMYYIVLHGYSNCTVCIVFLVCIAWYILNVLIVLYVLYFMILYCNVYILLVAL